MTQGDLLDDSSDTKEILDLFIKLKNQAPKKGSIVYRKPKIK